MFLDSNHAKKILANQIRTDAQFVALGQHCLWYTLPGVTGFDEYLHDYTARANVLLTNYAAIESSASSIECHQLANDLVSIAKEVDRDAVTVSKKGRGKSNGNR